MRSRLEVDKLQAPLRGVQLSIHGTPTMISYRKKRHGVVLIASGRLHRGPDDKPFVECATVQAIHVVFEPTQDVPEGQSCQQTTAPVPRTARDRACDIKAATSKGVPALHTTTHHRAWIGQRSLLPSAIWIQLAWTHRLRAMQCNAWFKPQIHVLKAYFYCSIARTRVGQAWGEVQRRA